MPHCGFNISQTFYPIGAVSGILLGKYLVFRGESLEKQMSGMNAEQIHNFKVLDVREHP